MPLKLSQIGMAERQTSLTYDGEKVGITYRPGKFTPRVEARLNEAQAESQVSQEVARVLADVLASWDVIDDDGKTLKPTVDLLMEMPLDFLTALATAVGEDMGPKSQNGAV